MATQYITLKKTDSAFDNYLSGTVDLSLRPIPVKSYHMGTADEAVTFELIPAVSVQNAVWLQTFTALVKPKTFTLVLFPFFYILLSSVGHRDFNFLTSFLSVLAAIALLSALNIRNDVVDHYSGYDRVNVEAKPKPIMQGWITAHEAKKLSNKLLIITAFLAAPVVIINPSVLAVVAASAILFFAGRLLQKNSYKNQHIGEISLFLLTGPAYFAGLCLAAGLPFITKHIVFSIIWGLAVLFLIQVNNFSHIMTSSQNQIKNTMTKLGFDRAQNYLIAHWLFFTVLWGSYQINQVDIRISGVLAIILLALSVHFFYNIKRIKSPMGSGLFNIRKQAYKIFTVMVVFSCVLVAAPVIWYLFRQLPTGQP